MIIKKPKNIAWIAFVVILISAEICMFLSFALGFKLEIKHVVLANNIIYAALIMTAVALFAHQLYDLITIMCIVFF